MPTVIYPESSGSSGSAVDLTPVYVDEDFSIATGNRYFIDTIEQAVTATLDGALANGESFELVDLGNNAATNNVTLAWSGVRLNKLDQASSLTLSTDQFTKRYLYVGAANCPLNVVRTAFNVNAQGDQYVQLNIGDKGSAWTVMGWFKVPTSGSRQILFTMAGSGTMFTELAVDTSGDLVLGSGNASSQATDQTYTSTAYDDGAEHFFCLVKESNSSIRCYVDGSEVGSAINPTYQATAYAYLRVGRDKDSNYQDIYVRQLSVWDTNIDGAGITEAYNSGTPGLDLSGHSDVANLDHWWKMDEDETANTAPYTFLDEIASADGTYQNEDEYTFEVVSTSYVDDTSVFEEKPIYEFLP